MTTLAHESAIERGDPTQDLHAYKRSLGQFATGVAVMTTTFEGTRVGVTANSFSSLSMEPALVLWSIALTSRSITAFTTADHFAVNILTADQIDVSLQFASKAEDKFETVSAQAGHYGSPIIAGALAVFECEKVRTFEGGDHIVIVGRVKHFARYAGQALLYSQGRFTIAADPPLQAKVPT